MLGRLTKNNHASQQPNSGKPSAAASLGKKTAPSVLSSDMHVLGNIISEGFLDIDGKIEGNVKCDTITVRSNGRIMGDVIAENVQVYGRIEGLVKARHVSLFGSSHVTGVIMHESLSIEDGAFIDGKLKRTDKVFIDETPNMPAFEETLGSHSEEPTDENPLDNLRLISA